MARCQQRRLDRVRFAASQMHRSLSCYQFLFRCMSSSLLTYGHTVYPRPDEATVVILLNDANGGFTMRSNVGIEDANRRVESVVLGDIDNDGFIDLFVIGTEVGQPDKLFKNNGNSTFAPFHTADLSSYVYQNYDPACAAAFADFNLDGHLDLFVSSRIHNQRNRLYLGEGDGRGSLRREDSSSFDALLLPASRQRGDVIESVWPADYDGDGWVDLFVIRRGRSANLLLRNTGARVVGFTSQHTPGDDLRRDSSDSVTAAFAVSEQRPLSYESISSHPPTLRFPRSAGLGQRWIPGPVCRQHRKPSHVHSAAVCVRCAAALCLLRQMCSLSAVHTADWE